MIRTSNVESIYLYCGLCRNVSGWFKQPPARFLRSDLGNAPSSFPLSKEDAVVAFQEPKNCSSFQVFDKENNDVLINLHIDNWK